jgi:RNA polymerase sigma factor (sigma-70 family)
MTPNAESFIRACREGGPQIETWLRAFDRDYGPQLYQEAAQTLRNWRWAEDVVQDTLVKVWLRCASFRGESQPLPWIRQILRRALIDALRARPPEEPLLDADGETSAAAQAAIHQLSQHRVATPEGLHHTQQVDKVFQQGFQRFANHHPEHAAALRWVIEDELDNSALAQLLGRSPGATREFMSQCRKKAQPFLAEWYALINGPMNVSPKTGTDGC